MVTDGSVSTDSGNDVVLTTTGKPGSCVGIVSPDAYSSDVVEVDVNLPALPGNPGTIANWSGIWLTDRTNWPDNGELDAVETVPNNGESGVTWHWGTASSPLSISTGGAPEGTLPIDGPNITPGWHVVDIVYTKGFFAVYYDGREYTSLSSDIITGSALSILITELVAPDNSEVEQEIAGTAILARIVLGAGLRVGGTIEEQRVMQGDADRVEADGLQEPDIVLGDEVLAERVPEFLCIRRADQALDQRIDFLVRMHATELEHIAFRHQPVAEIDAANGKGRPIRADEMPAGGMDETRRRIVFDIPDARFL